MLNLHNHISLDKDTINSPNLADRFTSEDLQAIGDSVYKAYIRDKNSRTQWEVMQENAMNFAMQVAENKSIPWENCSNIVFPLITIAALQFHATAYPALVNGKSVVKMRVFGDDPTGALRDRARKVSQYMSWQLLEGDTSWEEDTDRALLIVPIVGCAFKKTYHKADIGKNVSELVYPMDLIINYHASSMEKATTLTHIIPYTRNDIYERVRANIFSNVLDDAWFKSASNPQNTRDDVESDRREGVTPPQPDLETPFIGLEQHGFWDLDDDGYAEPYIITIEENSKTVLRIVARVANEEAIDRTASGVITRIQPEEYFTKIPFIPSPDGSIYDMGFGMLLGPLNDSVNSALNQLFDAGTLANTAGGFLGRGAKFRGGMQEFDPFSWNRVDSTGDDLRKSIFPLPVREPSNVMFQLLSLIIEYTNQIAGATEATMGVNPGQNQPADVYRTRVEMGQKIYAAIFKRIWRSMKFEFRKFYTLNGMYLPATISFGSSPKYLTRADFLEDSSAIAPAADPNIESRAIKLSKAMALRQAAATNPAYQIDEIEHRYMDALDIDDQAAVYTSISKVPPKQDPRIQIQQMKTQQAMAQIEFEKMKFLMNLYEQRKLTMAKITNLYAQADLFVKQAGGAQSTQTIEMFTTAMDALKMHLDSINQSIQTAETGGSTNGAQIGNQTASAAGSGGVENSPSNPAALPAPQGNSGEPNGAVG